MRTNTDARRLKSETFPVPFGQGWNVGEGQVAETEGFEPSVRVIPVRRFSKPLVSATHPRLRMRRSAAIAGACPPINGRVAIRSGAFSIPSIAGSLFRAHDSS
jgi:hypothetical protein